MEKIKRIVAIYVRVSTSKQDADNQLLQLRKYCTFHSILEHDVYLDIISGKETSRPEYDRLFIDASKGLFNLVLFWDLSRFSRSGTLFTLQKLRELDNLGIAWKSFQEPYLDSIGQFKDVVISIMSTLAKIEREKISERTKAGLERTKSKGTKLGRPKGKKDRKQRKRKGYFDNKNKLGKSKKGVSNFS